MKHKRHRRHNRKQGKIIIISMLCLMFIMTIGYAAFSTNINITAKGNILEQSRVVQSWSINSNEDFHTDYYREKIVSATFLDNNNVPSNAIESWNVSEDVKGGVMAWVVPNNEDNTKYDLYIGANKGVIANENSGYLFFNFVNLTSIEFNDNFDTSRTISMVGMFQDCIKLVTIDLSNFDTSNVVDMRGLFSMWFHRETSSSLSEINISGLNTENVINMRDMFAYNQNLKNIIGLTELNTNKVETMQGMFYDLKSYKKLDLSTWNTNALIDTNQMFAGCSNLEELNLCNFNTQNVTNVHHMFLETPNLKNIYVGPNWITSNADITGMFYNGGVSSVTTGQC